MNFFLDNCLSPRYAKSLDILSERDGKIKVVHLLDKFERDATDQLWMRTLAKESDWVIVSGDTRIIKSPELKAEWLKSGLTAFFLEHRWMNEPYWGQVAHLVRVWPDILQQARLVEAGNGFQVPFPRGKFKPVR